MRITTKDKEDGRDIFAAFFFLVFILLASKMVDGLLSRQPSWKDTAGAVGAALAGVFIAKRVYLALWISVVFVAVRLWLVCVLGREEKLLPYAIGWTIASSGMWWFARKQKQA